MKTTHLDEAAVEAMVAAAASLPFEAQLRHVAYAAFRRGQEATVAAIGTVSDEDLEADYRRWWAESYGVPPNRQAVATTVAWGRQLLNSITARFQLAASLPVGHKREQGR